MLLLILLWIRISQWNRKSSREKAASYSFLHSLSTSPVCTIHMKQWLLSHPIKLKMLSQFLSCILYGFHLPPKLAQQILYYFFSIIVVWSLSLSLPVSLNVNIIHDLLFVLLQGSKDEWVTDVKMTQCSEGVISFVVLRRDENESI